MAVCAAPNAVYAGGDVVRLTPGGDVARPLLLAPSADVTSCQFLLMSQSEVKALIPEATTGTPPAPSEQIDYQACAYLWSFGLTTVVSLYLVSKYVGEIVGFIRSSIR